MRWSIVGKGMVLGIICLFIGASGTPMISNVVLGSATTNGYSILWQIVLPRVSYFIYYQADSGDMDGDGKDELALIPNEDEYGSRGDEDPLILVDDNGSVVWSQMILKEQCCISVEDYDLDGKSEIFVGASDKDYYNAHGHIWAYRGNGSLIWEFVDTDDYGFWCIIPSFFIFKNIDSDPQLEVIASNSAFPPKNNYAVDDDGSLIWRHKRSDSCDVLLADINGDGDNEIILLTGVDRKVFAIDPYDGSLFWQLTLINYNYGSIGDLTGDGIDDILVVSKGQDLYSTDKIYAVRNDGYILWEKLINDNYCRYPILEDIDNDGKMDVILSENNRILAWKNDGTDILWESFAPYNVRQLYRFDIDADGVYDMIFFANKSVYSVNKEGIISKVFDLPLSDNWRVMWTYQGKVTYDKSRFGTRLVTADTNGNGIQEFFVEEDFSDYVRISCIEPQVDHIPPMTIKYIGSPKYGLNDEWVTSDTGFNLTAVDDMSGVKATYYRIWHNGVWGDWLEYTDNFTLSGEGKHYLEYYSVDNAGNQEDVHNQTHYVDDTPPTTLINITYDSYGNIRYVTFTADDNGGVDHCMVYWATRDRFGDLIWHSQPDSVTFKGDAAKEVVEFYSVDALGNPEPVRRVD